MADIKERFNKFNNANLFSRVDNIHPLNLHIGLDEKGRKAIELRAKFKPRKVVGTSSIEVNQYRKDEYGTIRFSLTDEEVSGLFYKFCEDLVEQTRDLRDVSEGYTAIVSRFFQWKKMFVSPKHAFLTEPEIMGLIGEILYMRDVLSKDIGLSKALSSWSGQELTHKDFSYDNTWTEVKTISKASQFVKISSLEQLESDNEGELAVYALEKMSPAYNGISLNKLVLQTRNMFVISDDKDLFLSKVAIQGYEYNNYYDEFVYELSSFRKYKVDNSFPKLTSSNVPAAIRKASYELALLDIEHFEIKE